MVKHNNVVPNVHLNKDWQEKVKTWFNQPGRKHRRRVDRECKAKLIGPNPTHKLRQLSEAKQINITTKSNSEEDSLSMNSKKQELNQFPSLDQLVLPLIIEEKILQAKVKPSMLIELKIIFQE